MQKLITLVLLALVATAIAASPATPQTGQKVWICHKTGATFSTNAGTFTKFVAIRVSSKAATAHMRHGDVAVSPAPTGTRKAQRQAAKTACAALRVVAPITPTSGGKKLDVTLTGGSITGGSDRADPGRTAPAVLRPGRDRSSRCDDPVLFADADARRDDSHDFWVAADGR